MIVRLTVLLLAGICLAKSTFPAIISSSKLIPGLKPSLGHSEQLPFDFNEATFVIERVFEQCSSDAYILVNVPGLKVEDFHHFEKFHHLRSQLAQASTIVSLPNVVVDDERLDFQSLERYLRIHCDTYTHTVWNENSDEVSKYIDVHKRTIVLDLVGLNDEMTEEERLDKLGEYDDLLREVMRKLPSPLFTILFTTTTASPYTATNDKVLEFDDIPDDPHDLGAEIQRQVKEAQNMIFPDITVFDKTRFLEFERNDKGERPAYGEDIPDGMWAKDVLGKDETWLEKKTKEVKKDSSDIRFGEDQSDIPVIFDHDFLVKNGPILIGGLFTIISLILLDLLLGIGRRVANLFVNQKTIKKD
ncbi:hypothetical protein OGAPHI_005963 [Ogataea philodendri]|uniref:Protein BIG1 n=1 Tax=Ogataea philodendri TaxID=1378263 RepID=A0A9P8NXW1_9ASCO|nr:uncharacterized protein OGAPHI_005963 [Ogataea philodendri]KAH3661785.1 hypothetical protein OGAPHI_005963 [Ogataea philodendri]